MLISDLIDQKACLDVASVHPDNSLPEAAHMLLDQNIGFLIVLDDHQNLAGVVSERDIARSIARFDRDLFVRKVADIMTCNVITCTPTDHVTDILDVMTERNIRHIPVVAGRRTLAILSIKEFHHAYQQLQAEARIDYLTGLANRRYFMEILEAEISRRRRHPTLLSIAIVDLDHFKRINDTHGHEAGDDVLRAFARLMKHELRDCDCIGRIGGEEFAILFRDTDLEGAALACNRIARTVRKERVDAHGTTIRFTASFGVVEATDLTEEMKSLLSQADTLLYEAKAEGRDRIKARMVSKTLPKHPRQRA